MARTRGSKEESAIAALASVHGVVPGLKGVAGKLRLLVADVPVGVLQIEVSGETEIVSDSWVGTLIAVDTQQTLALLLRGELNPIVAYLQDQLRVEGDRALALRVLLGLQAGSPWNVATQAR